MVMDDNFPPHSLENTPMIRFLLISLLIFPCLAAYGQTSDLLAPYRYKSNFTASTGKLSEGCAYIRSSSTDFGEALAMDFSLTEGSLMLADVALKTYRPLVGCENTFDVSVNSAGEVTSAVFETKNLTIDNDAGTRYELKASFDASRNPVSSAGGYKFDQVQYKTIDSKECTDITDSSTPISTQKYWEEVRFMVMNAEQDGETDLVDTQTDPASENLNSGPVSHWFYESMLEYASKFSTSVASDFTPDDEDFSLSKTQFDALDTAICKAYQGVGSKRDVYNAAGELAGLGYIAKQFANNWEEFEYIDTGATVIASPSPEGLEYYTKYIGGAGIIIVAGGDVEDEAMLAVREAFLYMTSARPEMRGILQRSNARLSLFTTDASILPEYSEGKKKEAGGFAQTRFDANMTANANMFCYPGNSYEGGNPAIHELGHTINHLVFEETNQTYWYDRIWKTADADRSAGKTAASLPLSEYWAKAVEGYIMNAGYKHVSEFPTREFIENNHPELYELLVRYFPTTKFDYCSQ